MMSRGLLFTSFLLKLLVFVCKAENPFFFYLLKLLVFVCKAENLVAFLFIHTIQFTFMASKSHHFFCCVLPNL